MELLLNKYFPLEKGVEFLKLVQGNMTLVEYECKFYKLAHYTPHLVYTEQCKTMHFEKGLRLKLYNLIVVLRLLTYIDVLQRVQLIMKDQTPQVPKAIHQNSFAPRKPWRGEN